jgi:DNA-binding transcriptional LysR family regulator
MVCIDNFDERRAMELRQLQTFRIIAQTLSFTRAADTLNYAQSSVSSQIQELGALLFERLGRKVVLTDAGKRLLHYAEKILTLTEEARTVVANQEEPAGTLTITAPETLCTYRLPAVLDQFRQQFPRVELIFRPYDRYNSWERQLAEGIADAALILSEPIQTTQALLEPLVHERIFVLTSPEHSLTRCASVSLADLAGETLLLTEAGCAYRLLFERALHQLGVRLGMILEFHSVEAIKQCTMSGLGVAVLPEVAVRAEVDQGRLAVLPFTDQEFTMLTLLAWHKDKWLSPALRAFLAVTRQILRKADDFN